MNALVVDDQSVSVGWVDDDFSAVWQGSADRGEIPRFTERDKAERLLSVSAP